LPILLAAVWKPGLNWFSRVRGDFADNLTVVASTDDKDVLATCRPPRIEGAVSRFIGDRFAVREYEATSEVNAFFGIDDESDQMASNNAAGPWLLTSHDEHWTTLYPASDRIVERILEGMLEQLAFLIGREITWGRASQELKARFDAHESLRLDARSLQLRAPSVINVDIRSTWPQPTLWDRVSSLFRVGPRYRTIGRIRVADNTAESIFDAS
jgi:hypothetical protein